MNLQLFTGYYRVDGHWQCPKRIFQKQRLSFHKSAADLSSHQ